MTTVIGVRFKKVGRMYYFDPCGLELKKDYTVIVETQRGIEMGECVMAPCEVEDEKIVPPLRKVIRIATEGDMETLRLNVKKEKDAVAVFMKKVADHKLVMKFVQVEYAFDGSKIVFFFTADGRVDFRDLVKDLASQLRTRIELRQIGVRDEAKMLGGLGICGRPFCCSGFLEDFQPVSIKMAKEQSLSLNPTKISGTCGRLMCCLKYEQEAYEDLLSNTPRVDAVVMTPAGQGVITDVSLLRGNLKIRLDAAPDVPVKVYHKSEIEVLQNGTRKNRKPRPAPPPEARPGERLARAEKPAPQSGETPRLTSVPQPPRPKPVTPEPMSEGSQDNRPKSGAPKGDRRPFPPKGGKPRSEGQRSGNAGNRPPRPENKPRPEGTADEGQPKPQGYQQQGQGPRRNNNNRRRNRRPRPEGEGRPPKPEMDMD